MTVLAKHEQAALARIAVLEDVAALRSMMANARRLGAEAVEKAAFERLAQVQPGAEEGSLAFDVWRSIFALEEMLVAERGKTVRLSRTRQKIARDGETRTVADLVMKPDASSGFAMLIERGSPALTFEAVVLRHPDTFSQPQIDKARARLAAASVDPDILT
jgi:hypothetical protein